MNIVVDVVIKGMYWLIVAIECLMVLGSSLLSYIFFKDGRRFLGFMYALVAIGGVLISINNHMQIIPMM